MKELYDQLERELSRVVKNTAGASERLKARLAELDVALSRTREHLASMDAATAKSLGLYEQARTMSDERLQILEELSQTLGEQVPIPTCEDIRARVLKEFDSLGDVLAVGSIEEKRELIAAYVHRVEAAPERQVLDISLLPDVLSQMVAGGRFDLSESLRIKELRYR